MYKVKYLLSIDIHYLSLYSTAGDVISFSTRTSVRQTQLNVGLCTWKKITEISMGTLVLMIVSAPWKDRICL